MMGLHQSLPADILVLIRNNKLALSITCVCLAVPPLLYLYRYRSSIKKHLKEIETNASISKVVRNNSVDIRTSSRVIRCMELNPAFVKKNSGWQMMSFGEYLSQLEPADKNLPLNHIFYQKELEIALGKLLLYKLGNYGAALLPLLGVGSVAGSIAGVSKKISEFIAKSVLSDDTAVDPLQFDLSLMEITSALNLYQKGSSQSIDVTPLEYLARGEKGWGDLSFDMGDGTFPMLFDVDKDFDNYVIKMEERVRAKEGGYDPFDRSFPSPLPINERLLPGLCLGKGGLKITHNKRECIEHRLICVLFNKLAHNYYKFSRKQKLEDCFVAVCGGKRCIFPEQLLQALVHGGHEVEVAPRVMTTNFGIQLCVKEDDGSYTSIPTTLFILTGVERPSDGKPAYFAAPHGGMDVRISGPIFGKTKTAFIQFYVAISGICAFVPDEDQDTPWVEKTTLADPYSPGDMIRAIRMCALVSVTFNRIATELNLPCGGYGVLGMCNDSSTIIDFALRGKTNGYPLVSTGRYLSHIVANFIKLKEELNDTSCAELEPVAHDILCLIRSSGTMPSDLHITPASLTNLSERYDKSYQVEVFQGTVEAKEILSQMADAAKEYFG
jgi:hypothetical protein